ncbi:hypothetical protein ON010_g1309 [Phytophthora cinnamomi]|nr:hypothetical protein ON010_g1309 [Phytophthora cinnamomi]
MDEDPGRESTPSDYEVVSTSDSEWEPTSPSLSESEEGGYDEVSESGAELVSLSTESRVQELIDSNPCKRKCLATKSELIQISLRWTLWNPRKSGSV